VVNNGNVVEVPVSLGELIDKYTILLIKSDKITNEEKLKNVHHERDLLKQKIDSLSLDGVEKHIAALKDVNLKLWVIEDDIRLKEKAKEFDDKFIELARAVYVTNDERFEHKSDVNAAYGSNVVEVKSYEDYQS
jgi:hypothetical protein